MTNPQNNIASGKVRKWEVFPGRNRFCCNGWIMLSTQTGIFYFTLFLIISTSALFFAIDARFTWEKINPVLPILAALQFIFVVAVLCRTACGDPGIIPRASPAEAAALERLIAREADEANAEAKKNNQTYHPPPRIRETTINGVNFKLKYCYTCKIFRPPRASHCSVCDNCVDRFDHHCPWVGNCVGRRNYKYFYLFLSSLTFYCAYLMALSIASIALRANESSFAEAMSDGPLSPVVALVAFFSIWSVAGLAGFHTYLTGLNMTTNEDIKGTFKQPRKNPFSAGSCCANFSQVLCGPLPPSLIDRRGWVSEHDIPPVPSNGTAAAGRVSGNTSVYTGSTAAGANNHGNHKRVVTDSNVTLRGDSYPRQPQVQRNSNEASQISNGRAPPKYLPPIEQHVSSQNREFLT